MPRPKTKDKLLELSQKSFDKLNDLVDSFATKELNKEFPEGYLNRNIKDVFAHLHHWHLLMLEWYTIGMGGNKPDMPAKGYTWKTLPDFNREIQKNIKTFPWRMREKY
nr:ClbS/DfsB family four-helix bundle protein [Maribacter sp. Hal144]